MTERERVARAMIAASRPTADPDALTPAPRGMVGMVPIWQTFGHLADAALSAMSPAWRPIPAEVREGEAPFDGGPTLLWWQYWADYPVIGFWEYGGWSSQVCLSDGPPPTHYMPLPAPPSAEEG